MLGPLAGGPGDEHPGDVLADRRGRVHGGRPGAGGGRDRDRRRRGGVAAARPDGAGAGGGPGAPAGRAVLPGGRLVRPVAWRRQPTRAARSTAAGRASARPRSGSSSRGWRRWSPRSMPRRPPRRATSVSWRRWPPPGSGPPTCSRPRQDRPRPAARRRPPDRGSVAEAWLATARALPAPAGGQGRRTRLARGGRDVGDADGPLRRGAGALARGRGLSRERRPDGRAGRRPRSRCWPPSTSPSGSTRSRSCASCASWPGGRGSPCRTRWTSSLADARRSRSASRSTPAARPRSRWPTRSTARGRTWSGPSPAIRPRRTAGRTRSG